MTFYFLCSKDGGSHEKCVLILIFIALYMKPTPGLSWWLSLKVSSCQSWRQRFGPWSRETSYVAEQLSLCATTMEPVPHNERSLHTCTYRVAPNSLGRWMLVCRFSSNLENFQSLFFGIFFHSSFSHLLQRLHCIVEDLIYYIKGLNCILYVSCPQA